MADDRDNPIHLEPHTKDAALFPAHDEPIAPPPRRTVDKQSTEYMIKSGIAGGLAGCAVRVSYMLINWTSVDLFTRPKQ